MNSDPMDTPLPCEVICGPIRFGKGVKLRTLAEAAERWRKIAQNHIMCCHDADGGRAALDAFKTAITKFGDADSAADLNLCPECGARWPDTTRTCDTCGDVA